MVALACRVRTGHRLTTRARSAGSALDFAPPSAEPDVVAEDSGIGRNPLGGTGVTSTPAAPRNWPQLRGVFRFLERGRCEIRPRNSGKTARLGNLFRQVYCVRFPAS